jgi:uncharacterized protein YigE (DUF2233 family)
MIPAAIRLAAALILCLALASERVAAAPCRSESFEGTDYTVCSFDLTATDLRMFWRDGEGKPYRTFSALADALSGEGKSLAFAMNGGMYGDDFAPIGLYIKAGRELVRANTTTVPGEGAAVPNFYKKPNGVFYVGGEAAGVMETEAFIAARPDAEFATQSGPMLVIGGRIHPAFIEGSTDRKRRNGVGVSGLSEVHFAISEEGVNFWDFARFFREKLGCDNALFLDGGTAPGLYAPALDRNDPPGHGGYGPIIAVVE